MAVPGVSGPAAEAIGRRPLPSCDAVASGAEDGPVQFARGHGELTLCGHHAAEHELFLTAAGWHVTRDDRASYQGTKQ